MLADSPLIAFIPVSDTSAARSFYESTLGLSVAEETPFALVVDAHGTMLRLTPVSDFQAQNFTIAGWMVDDIERTVASMHARGIVFNWYAGMEQGSSGIWVTPNGDKVAWFRDPDGNTLSLTQFTKA
jgi:catechol 2,3-dioxygenase-like lactoylglutathione lyase family enzyme